MGRQPWGFESLRFRAILNAGYLVTVRMEKALACSALLRVRCRSVKAAIGVQLSGGARPVSLVVKTPGSHPGVEGSIPSRGTGRSSMLQSFDWPSREENLMGSENPGVANLATTLVYNTAVSVPGSYPGNLGSNPSGPTKSGAPDRLMRRSLNPRGSLECSSVVEQEAVNFLVAGSNPAIPARH